MPERPRIGKKSARDMKEHGSEPIDNEGRLSDCDSDISNCQQQRRQEEEMDIEGSLSRRARITRSSEHPGSVLVVYHLP